MTTFTGCGVLFLGLTPGQIKIIGPKVTKAGGAVVPHKVFDSKLSEINWAHVTHIVMQDNQTLAPSLLLKLLHVSELPPVLPLIVKMRWINDCDKKRGERLPESSVYLIPMLPEPEATVYFSPSSSSGGARPPRSISALASLPAANLNDEVVQVFKELLKYPKQCNADSFRHKSYLQSIATLRRIPFRITDIEQINGHSKYNTGFGYSNLRKIAEIIEDGTCNKLREMQANPDRTAMKILTSVHGIGFVKAVSLLRDEKCKTLEDLHALLLKDPSKFSEPQKLGLAFHEEILMPIPMEEIQRFVAMLTAVAEEMEPNGVSLHLCGSASRGESSSYGDVDLVLALDRHHPEYTVEVDANNKKLDTKPEEEFMEKWLAVLMERGIVTHALQSTEGVNYFMGIGVDITLPLEKRVHRRLDLRVYAKCQACFALFYFRSATIFSRAVLNYCDRYFPEKAPDGLYVSNHGLFVKKGNIEKHKRILCDTEEDVFREIGLQYRPPSMRLSADDLVPLDLNDDAAWVALHGAQGKERETTNSIRKAKNLEHELKGTVVSDADEQDDDEFWAPTEDSSILEREREAESFEGWGSINVSRDADGSSSVTGTKRDAACVSGGDGDLPFDDDESAKRFKA